MNRIISLVQYLLNRRTHRFSIPSKRYNFRTTSRAQQTDIARKEIRYNYFLLTMTVPDMKTPSSFFWKSLGIAALLTGCGFAYSGYTAGKLASAQQKCEAESQSRMNAFNAQHAKETGPWSIYQTSGATCDPSKLYMDTPYGEVPDGAQGELLTAYRDEIGNTENVFYGVAFLILIIGITPVIWYFFLARLAEIATAVRRK